MTSSLAIPTFSIPKLGLKGTKLWFVAYAAVLVIPWALIYGRAVADSCGSIIGLLFLWHSYRHKQWQWLQDPLVRAGLLAWAWLVLIVSPFGADPEQSIITAAPWVRFPIFYAALRHWVLTDRNALLLLAKNLALMLIFVTADTLWQYIFNVSFTGNPRPAEGRLTGPFKEVKVGIFTARMLIPTFGLCLFFSLSRNSQPLFMATGLMMLVSTTTILLTGERTAFVSTFISLSLLILWFIVREPSYRKSLIATYALWIACLFYLNYSQSWVQQRSGNLHNDIANFSTSPYGELFKAGYLLGLDHPWAGVGLKGFRALCPNLIEQGKINYCNLHPHNPYIEWFAETGALGLCLLLVMCLSILAHCLKALRKAMGIYRILPVFALACLINNYFPIMATQSSFSNWPAILLWFSISVMLSSLNLVEKNPPENKQLES